ncbi:hypothetical protein KTE11_27025 [Burkholderia multivorans]|uniref:hypothetical protein n=1 Tax=Burkholderia multivorans TaxID=87883 RepID=UPI001C28093F|nr:hypothetical protein [Burkholderia multivorans]MBU9348357.1 hypothetical protein [Burkholderia multivorans]
MNLYPFVYICNRDAQKNSSVARAECGESRRMPNDSARAFLSSAKSRNKSALRQMSIWVRVSGRDGFGDDETQRADNERPATAYNRLGRATRCVSARPLFQGDSSHVERRRGKDLPGQVNAAT